MIITRTPLRISLAGGGTDMPEFYEQSEFGAVVSFTIDMYIYVSVNPKFDGKIRVSYSKTENVDKIADIQHDIIRETLRVYDAFGQEINIAADIPGEGTGMGSSSALTVGLVKAFDHYTDNHHPSYLAERAYMIEHKLCGHPCGKQDHYAAAYGGLHLYKFMQGGYTVSKRIIYPPEFVDHMTLLWTGRNRASANILKAQAKNFKNPVRHGIARSLRDLAIYMSDDLVARNLEDIPSYLKAGWEIKKTMAPGISNQWFDDIYEKAMAAGAQGGKLLGAGGGGFFLFWHPLGLGYEIAKATGLEKIKFHLTEEGSQVIHDSARNA